ncbi:MAG: hypothetical protein R3Y26_08965 [Rikenellaceae bacterium]
MKKRILVGFICVSFVITVLSCLKKANQIVSINSSLLVCEAEALTDCEYKDDNGDILFSCSGEGECSQRFTNGTVNCDGTKN